jgi:hypothetical protein
MFVMRPDSRVTFEPVQELTSGAVCINGDFLGPLQGALARLGLQRANLQRFATRSPEEVLPGNSLVLSAAGTLQQRKGPGSSGQHIYGSLHQKHGWKLAWTCLMGQVPAQCQKSDTRMWTGLPHGCAPENVEGVAGSSQSKWAFSHQMTVALHL